MIKSATIDSKTGDLTIVIAAKKNPSVSEKGNKVVYSTGGNQDSGVKVGDKPLIIGLNAYHKA